MLMEVLRTVCTIIQCQGVQVSMLTDWVTVSQESLSYGEQCDEIVKILFIWDISLKIWHLLGPVFAKCLPYSHPLRYIRSQREHEISQQQKIDNVKDYENDINKTYFTKHTHSQIRPSDLLNKQIYINYLLKQKEKSRVPPTRQRTTKRNLRTLTKFPTKK